MVDHERICWRLCLAVLSQRHVRQPWGRCKPDHSIGESHGGGCTPGGCATLKSAKATTRSLQVTLGPVQAKGTPQTIAPAPAMGEGATPELAQATPGRRRPPWRRCKPLRGGHRPQHRRKPWSGCGPEIGASHCVLGASHRRRGAIHIDGAINVVGGNHVQALMGSPLPREGTLNRRMASNAA